ncbi:Flp family type IVb pilin [Modestobacter sp. I12A-02628]|uniref:Flp family type IVb pilin n=1 Tax=Goekera deserti TaxID=2497753 RepID=A0A7K3WB64_9ACTN|nr:Flp family type IVb pilin [Goekera deserti]MPQ97577.1 Flp family type IVb pilin [Goekera deserti]NDI47819.1 Flp family type IVb pilin [Goekera deserti]NEL53567.1 Flp family type IVb pilin [Goekera deserti]
MVTLFQSLYTLSLVTADRVSGRVESLKGERGASAVEYALLVGLIAIAVVVAVGAFGGKLKTLFDGISIEAPKAVPTTSTAPTS